MTKKIIIYCLIFLVVFFTIVLFSLNYYGTVHPATIIILTIIFVVLFVRDCILPRYKNFKPDNERLFSHESVQIDLSTLKKISANSFFFGLEKRLMEDHEYYFDTHYFYPVNKSGYAIKIPLTEISGVSKTHTEINGRRIWQVKATHKNQEVVFKFMDNGTLFNNNFNNFLDQVKQINPTVIKAGSIFS